MYILLRSIAYNCKCKTCHITNLKRAAPLLRAKIIIAATHTRSRYCQIDKCIYLQVRVSTSLLHSHCTKKKERQGENEQIVLIFLCSWCIFQKRVSTCWTKTFMEGNPWRIHVYIDICTYVCMYASKYMVLEMENKQCSGKCKQSFFEFN